VPTRALTRAILIAATVISARPPADLFATLALTPEEIAAIDAGRPVAKVLSWGTPSEVYVFGAVHIDAPLEVWVKTVRDVARLSAAPGYFGAGKFQEEPVAADLTAVVLDADDVKALEDCKDGSCDVQLPVAAIEAFRDRIDWSQPDVDAQVNGWPGQCCCNCSRRTGAVETARSASIATRRIGTNGLPGFYLLTLKGSHQEGLTGVRGSLLRRVVVGKTRDSLERALAAIKGTGRTPGLRHDCSEEIWC
jgi:hypothetical protein